MRRPPDEPEHADFRASLRTFLAREAAPRYAAWEADRLIPRDVLVDAARHGFASLGIPLEHGGAGVADMRLNAIVIEECMYAGMASLCMSLSLQNDLCLPYLLRHGSQEQQERWLPKMASGDVLGALALTEPGAGSDLAAIATTANPCPGGYRVSGAKTFISGGLHCDIAIAAVKTDPTAGRRGITMLIIESSAEGFQRGGKIEKLGLHAQDTTELFFDDIFVPHANVLGREGGGFETMMSNLPQERMSIAILAVAGARAALDCTLEYVTARRAFGRPIGTFQNSRFALAEIATEVEIAETYIDRCIAALNAGELSADDAAKAKWWSTELQGRVVDRCLQLHGGYGYALEYPIARAYADARITRIYGGTNEIMKEIVGRSLGV
jgi:alkylation response protein AidB-like acyl-CoA dehydrogenase